MIRNYRLLHLFERGCVYLLTSLIKIYKIFISALLPASCRYYPTCSAYAAEALQKHGLFKGFYLAAKRVLSCNPYFDGGYDPVPDEFHFFKNR